MALKSTNKVSPNGGGRALGINLKPTVDYLKKLVQSDPFLALTLAATKGEDGDYHIDQNYWQKYFGYNSGYDWTANKATRIIPASFPFKYGNEDFVIWAWKGDYMNLGAGAELAIYKRMEVLGLLKTDHWLADKSLSIPMTLELSLKGEPEPIIDWTPDKPTWWITGFDKSKVDTGFDADDLTAVYTLNFSGSKKMEGMYDAFKETWDGVDERWDFSTEYHPVFTWEAK